VEVNKKPKKEKVTAENVEAKSDIVEVTLTPSKLADKKYSVKIGKKTINFGQKGASDYTINTDPIRK
jgi:ribosomal protein S8E